MIIDILRVGSLVLEDAAISTADQDVRGVGVPTEVLNASGVSGGDLNHAQGIIALQVVSPDLEEKDLTVLACSHKHSIVR